MELLPQRAPVKPRALTEDRSDSLPLEDEILSLIQRGQCGIVGIFGPPGSGKTTALRHLMAVIQEAEIHYEDVNQESLFVNTDDFHEQLQRIQSHVEGPGLMLYASTFRLPVAHRAKFDLSPWGFDDVLEYLVHRHRDRCAAILNRQDDSSQAELLSDLPALWAPVLDLMAVSDPIPDCLQALELYSEKVFQDQNQEHATRIAILSAHQPVRPEVLEQRAILFTDSRSRALLQKDWQPTPNEKIVEALLRDELQEILKNRTPEVQNALSSKYEGLFVELADFKKEGSFAAAQLLQVRSVAHLSLARRIVRDLEAKKISEFLGTPMPLQFVELAGSAVRGSPKAMATLEGAVCKNTDQQPMGVSILLKANSKWQPGSGRGMNYSRAFLDGIEWPEIDFRKASFRNAHLNHSNLAAACLNQTHFSFARMRRANLSNAPVEDACFDWADMQEANLSSIHGRNTNFVEAKMTRVCLRNASLLHADFFRSDLDGLDAAEADLSGSSFQLTNIEEANFTRALLMKTEFQKVRFKNVKLTGASFSNAELVECNLEHVSFPGADFEGASLESSDLTASFMPGANFRRADLQGTGLAEIEWERADLREADLRGATFHMGSSRSGLVSSPIASEGTRTGFYTDEKEEQWFRSPEEIRKANLCGADLRGANFEDVDFYLVDLRAARYDPEQEDHLRQSGAILESRVE